MTNDFLQVPGQGAKGHLKKAAVSLQRVYRSRAELRGKTILHIIAPHYSEVFERIKPEILSKEFSTVLLPVANAGRIITYESSISVNRTPEGRIAKIILILVKKVEEQVPVLAAI